MDRAGAHAIADACRAIARYLDACPEASDTLIGVTRWWLRREPDPDTVAITEAAVDQLIGTGVLERQPLPDGGCVYRKATAR